MARRATPPTQQGGEPTRCSLTRSDRPTRVDGAMSASSGERDTSAALLSALHHFLAAPSIDLSSDVLGLSHSGTVRLIDRLERAGYVTRTPSEDKRAVAVALTPAGRRVARNVAHARAATLEAALDPPAAEERSLFGELAGRIPRAWFGRQGRAAG